MGHQFGRRAVHKGLPRQNNFSPTAVFTTWITAGNGAQPTPPGTDTATGSITPSSTSDTVLPNQISTSTSITQTSTLPSTTSTSSTSTSTLQQSTPTPAPVQPATTAPLLASTPQASVVQFTTTPISASQTSSTASSTSSPQGGSASNVGGIVGGIAGGLAGLVLIIFIVRFLMRRQSRKDNGKGDIFSPSDFRRSAVLMNDPPTHEDTIARGFNPRPPSMIERRLASPAPTFGMQYGAPGPHPYGNGPPGHSYANPDPYASGQYSSFGPGQVMNNTAPNSAMAPMQQHASYAQSPFSPVPSPVSSVGAYEHARGEASPALTRQTSASMQDHQSYNATTGSHDVNYPAPAVIASKQNPGSYPSSGYVDLNRASVTPFQAAQYAEISRKLNSEIPDGLSNPMGSSQYSHTDIPPVPPKDGSSPFADPIPASLRPAAAARDRRSLTSQNVDRPVSAESHTTVLVADDFNFPEPPSPALTVASRFRVDSNPPTLPEIALESRASVHSSLHSVSPGVPGKGPSSRSPPISSPLATSFNTDVHGNSQPGVAPAAPDAALTAKEAKRPETLYNPEDAYGGI